MTDRKKAGRPRLERVSVRAELRREPDWDRFAWALLQHARLVNREADAKVEESEQEPSQ